MHHRLLIASLVVMSLVADRPLLAQTTQDVSMQDVSIERRLPVPPSKQITRPPRRDDMWQIPLGEVPPKMRLASFQSKIADRFVSYLVYTPPQYEKEPKRRFPVVYYLPAMRGDCREVGPMVQKFDQAIELGIMPPVIVVGVQGIYGSFYTDTRDTGRRIGSVIATELVPRIDATMRTIPLREYRGLEGFSMGAYGAAYLGFRYPETFGAVSMFAPPVGPLGHFRQEYPQIAADVWGNDGNYFAQHDPWELVGRQADMIRGNTKIRIFCGADDRFIVLAEDFHKRLDSLGIEHDFLVIPGGKHNSGQMLAPVAHKVFPFWKQAFPPYIEPETTPATQPSAR